MPNSTPVNPNNGQSLQDIAEPLDRLAKLLDCPQTPEFPAALSTLMSALVCWGEVLGLTDFVAFVHTTESLLLEHPDQTPLIAPLALQGLRAIYQQQVLGEFPFVSSALQLGQDQSVSSVTEGPDPGLLEGIDWLPPEQLPSEQTVLPPLATAHLFVWQAQSLIFTIPSAQLLEIVIPQSAAVSETTGGLLLNWQDHSVPIYQIMGERDPATLQLAPATHLELAASETVSLLLIQQETYLIAVHTTTDALITDPELPLMTWPAAPPLPDFCPGYVQWADQPPMLVLDMVVFLGAQLHLPATALPLTETVGEPGASVSLAQSRGSLDDPGASLPIVQPEAVSVAAPDPMAVESSSLLPLADPGAPLALGTQILCVDDSYTLRKIVASQLQAAGYEVFQAEDGQIALEKLQQYPGIRLIICDLEMPKMNGFELLRYCRSQPSYVDLPIVMLSSSNSDYHRQECEALGANSYFTKPYDRSEFLNRLAGLVASSKLV